ncbi:MAG: type I-E CRISPR-associated protein Cas5/CasD [Ruminococcus sp.]|jgi:CRISPR system Cascade subunit CasD|nr:type I-E CRISPR-associated protein Cas5/CasD [Ruminococcus sp.]
MAVLMLRLSAPLQSWGSGSKFDTRMTEREPTKSGVIGMLAAAFGYRRFEDEKIKELSKLRFGVKVIREGELAIDFQTVHSKKYWDDISAGKIPNGNGAYISRRYYLSDAIFAVGLEGDRELLEAAEYALTHPYFPLYLGRKSCPPVGKVVIGITDSDLLTALQNYSDDTKISGTRILTETTNGGYTVKDEPITFNRTHRKYASRQVNAVYINNHDVFGETEE